jgi:hypothetical protein
MISPASVVCSSGKTRLNDPNRMRVDACRFNACLSRLDQAIIKYLGVCKHPDSLDCRVTRVCRKPSRFSQSEYWGWIRAVFVNAHKVTVAEAREISICCLCASKSFKNIWPSLRTRQALNDHVCASLLPLQPLGSSTSADEADSASLAGVAANIELSENS